MTTFGCIVLETAQLRSGALSSWSANGRHHLRRRGARIGRRRRRHGPPCPPRPRRSTSTCRCACGTSRPRSWTELLRLAVATPFRSQRHPGSSISRLMPSASRWGKSRSGLISSAFRRWARESSTRPPHAPCVAFRHRVQRDSRGRESPARATISEFRFTWLNRLDRRRRLRRDVVGHADDLRHVAEDLTAIARASRTGAGSGVACARVDAVPAADSICWPNSRRPSRRPVTRSSCRIARYWNAGVPWRRRSTMAVARAPSRPLGVTAPSTRAARARVPGRDALEQLGGSPSAGPPCGRRPCGAG